MVTSGNTTNAWNHLQTYHKYDYYKLTENNPKGIIVLNVQLIQKNYIFYLTFPYFTGKFAFIWFQTC
jgi:hypothetical protein